MRLIKMVGLAALAALAAMAFVGAGSASADVLCTENVGHGAECPSSKIVAANTLIVGTSTDAILLDNELNVEEECDSTTLGKYLGSNGAHNGLKGLITLFDFTNCVGLCDEAVGHSAPFNLFASAATLHATVTGDNGSLQPGARLQGCPFGVTCLYQTPSALLEIDDDLLIAEHVPLNRSSFSFVCPSETAWDATYLLTIDNEAKTPVFIALKP